MVEIKPELLIVTLEVLFSVFIALLVASTTLLVAFVSFAGLSDLKNSPKEIKKVIELEGK